MGCDSGSSLTGAASEGATDAPVSLSLSIVDGTALAGSDGATSAFGKSGTIDLTRVRLLLRTIQIHSDDSDAVGVSQCLCTPVSGSHSSIGFVHDCVWRGILL